jgi:transposase
MKKEFLTEAEYAELRARHRSERDGRIKDRIKVVLLSNNGWTYKKIAEALFIDEETVSKHVDEYINDRKLSIQTGGSKSKLQDTQKETLIKHLQKYTYSRAIDICKYVQDKYNVNYTSKSMANWLRFNGFSYKKPKGTPKDVSPALQRAFIKEYRALVKNTPEKEPILFMDAVHPTMSTKIGYGWIKKGTNKLIKSTAARTRINIVGSINLKSMDVEVKMYETVNSESVIDYFDVLRTIYDGKIHVVLDRSGYHTSEKTMKAAEERNIVIHFLPPYSPNLNPIERLWKVMNEYTRNNRYFANAKKFKYDTMAFFSNTWSSIKEQMRTRVNDNFCLSKDPAFHCD